MDRQVQADAPVGAEKAVAIGDDDVLDALGVRCRDLLDPRIETAGDRVGTPQERDFAAHGHVAGIDRDGAVAGDLVGNDARRVMELSTLFHAPRRAAGERDEVVRVGDVPVRVRGALARRDPDARALI